MSYILVSGPVLYQPYIHIYVQTVMHLPTAVLAVLLCAYIVALNFQSINMTPFAKRAYKMQKI